MIAKRLFKLIFQATGLIVATSIWSADDKIELYNAASSPVKSFICNSTVPKGFSASSALEDIDNQKWLKITCSGPSKGVARVTYVLKDKLTNQPKDFTIKGIGFKIKYDSDDYRNLPVTLVFADNIMVKHLALQKGDNEYYFDTGWTRKQPKPEDWRNLRFIQFKIPSKKAPEFYIQEMFLTMKKSKIVKKELEIQQVRKVQEILPGRDSSTLSFEPSSPFIVKAGYDNENLYINSTAKYPDKPVASFKPGDKQGSLWTDELTEYFFDSWNDNRCFIQFVCNMNGATWDTIMAYDQVAAMIIRRSNDWDLEHEKQIIFEDNTWKTSAVFPLKALHADPKKPFIGFQIVQHYDETREKGVHNIEWVKCKNYTFPCNFGFLVFNKKPFGPAEIEISKATANLNDAAGTAEFILNCDLKGFTPGEYTVRKFVTCPDISFQELTSQKLNIADGNTKQEIILSDVKSMDGRYTIYVGIVNKSGDMKLAAINVENAIPIQDLTGKPVFCPEPKEIKWGNGAFNIGENNVISVPENVSERTMLTAKLLKKRIHDFTGCDYKISKGGQSGIILEITPKVLPAKLNAEFRRDGYRLSIGSKDIKISGGGEPGLFYGCTTLVQMIKQPMKRTVKMPVKAAEIVDYPDLPVRFVNLMHPWTFFNRKFKERHSIDYLIDWVDRFAVGTKLNYLIINMDSIVKYRKHPEFNKANTLYTLEDIAKLSKFCRDNFIQVIPRWQVGGHANFWLLSPHPELKDPGFLQTADVTIPEHNKIVFDCIQELLDATGSKYINVGGDEWWHKPEKGKVPPEKLYNGMNRQEAFLYFFTELGKLAKKNNARIMIHEDMIYPFHNASRFDNYKNLDKLSKDIIFLPWACRDPGIKFFHERKFDQWVNPTGVWFPKNTKKLIQGFGLTIYSFFYTLPLTGQKMVESYVSNVLRSAEFGWNMNRDKEENLSVWISSGKIPALLNLMALPALPTGSPEVTPIKLGKEFNANLSQLVSKEAPAYGAVTLPGNRKAVANIPAVLKSSGQNCIRIGKNKKITIELQGKYSSLIFLHTVLTTDAYLNKYKKILSWRNWIYGYPAGDYYVIYEDGSKEKLPLRMNDNIWSATSSPNFRVCMGCRYILPVKTTTGNYIFLYQWEWANPHPEKKITGIELTQSVVDFNLLLFSISGRKNIK